jgi:hypothetical protein
VQPTTQTAAGGGSGIQGAVTGTPQATPAATPAAGTTDYSIFTGEQPTATPSPLADQTIAPSADTIQPSTPSTAMKALQSLGLVNKDLTGVGTNALPLAGLVGSQIMQNKANKSLPSQLTQAAAPASNAANTLLQEGLSGQAPAAVVAQAQQQYNQQVQEINQRYAAMGRDPSTDTAAQYEISQAGLTMQEAINNYSTQLTSQGLQAAQIAQGPTVQAATTAAQQDQNLSNSIASTLQNMALIQSLNKGSS